MLVTTGRKLARDEGGAIAPLYALALFGLIGMAGVGFDYARVMALDTELQNAADQAALAAATQLDGRLDSVARAQTKARQKFATASSAYVNMTRLSNVADSNSTDNRTGPITSVDFAFWEKYVNDNPVTLVANNTTDGRAARVVQVTVGNRVVRYALTPIVGAIVGNAGASAMAAVEQAICKVPPLMICVPDDTATKKFPEDYVGVGVLMKPGGGGFWTPGTFGYLDFGNGATTVKALLGSNEGINGCASANGVEAQEGNIASAPDYLNTRFDIYRNNISCSGSNNCPATNTRKDFVRKEEWTYSNSKPTSDPVCSKANTSTSGNSGNPSIKISDLAYIKDIPSTGYTRDTCHYSDTCAGGKYGNGTWDAATYFQNVYGGTIPSGSGLSTSSTRYAIYKYERDNNLTANPVLAKKEVVDTTTATTGKKEYKVTNYCSYAQPLVQPPVVPSSTQKDRRLITVAAVDCSKSGSGHSFSINRWVDVFLVEPSESRTTPGSTGADEIYGEIAGPGTRPDGGSAFQYYGRNRVVLLR